MRLRIVGVGKLRDAAITRLCDEYEKRSRSFFPIERLACRDVASAWQRAERWSAESPSRVALLDERGDQLSSEALAAWLTAWRDQGIRGVSFLIGDADGFGEADRARADRVLSLSRLTLPHRLAHVVLAEQLYRAGTIAAGHPYHHGA